PRAPSPLRRVSTANASTTGCGSTRGPLRMSAACTRWEGDLPRGVRGIAANARPGALAHPHQRRGSAPLHFVSDLRDAAWARGIEGARPAQQRKARTRKLLRRGLMLAGGEAAPNPPQVLRGKPRAFSRDATL